MIFMKFNIRTGILAIIALLVNPVGSYAGLIHEAILRGKITIVKHLLSSNPDLIKERTQEGESPIHLAARYKQNDIVDYLKSEGAIQHENEVFPNSLKSNSVDNLSLDSLGSFPYFPTHEQNFCVNPEIQDLKEVDSEDGLSEALDQKDTATCYGHSAYYLVQYLWNKNNFSSKQNKLSFLDILGKGCGHKFKKGGHSYSVLHNLRKEGDVKIQDKKGEPHIQDVMNFDEEQKICGKADISGRCQKAKQLLGISTDGLEAIVSDLVEFPETFTHRLLSKTIHRTSTKLPNYDIHVFEKGSHTHEEVYSEVDRVLSDRMPLSLSYLGHEAAIVGSRMLCCGPADNRKCVREWKIHNSYGENYQGQDWLLAEPLAGGTENLTHLSECDESNCKPFIQGDFPLHYLIVSGDTEELKKRIVDRTFDIKAKRNNQSVLDFAVAFGLYDVVTLIISQNPDMLYERDGGGSNQAHTAARKGYLNIMKFLAEKSPEIMMELDDFGQTPAHWAAFKGHLNIIEFVIQHSPASLVIKDREGKTAFDLIQEKFGETSEEFQRIVKLFKETKT